MPAAPLASAVRRGLDRWLFRVGRQEAAPIVLGQRRIFVLPSAAGLAYAAALGAMLLASINYNLSLGYALVFLLAGMAVASIVHAFRNLLHLSIRPGRSQPVFAGDTATLVLLVGHSRDERRPALQIRARDGVAEFDLDPGATIEVPLHCAAARRGWLRAERVIVETRYPLGLIRAWSVLRPDVRCLVYPAPESPAPPLPGGGDGSAGGHAMPDGDDDFAGFRAHRPSDSPRHVAWKRLAHGGPMLTKEFSGHAGAAVRLDWHALPPELGVEARLSRLTAWVIAAEASGARFALALPDGTSAFGSGAIHAAQCLQRLALFGLDADALG